MSKLDINAPWLKVDVPNVRHDFNTADPFVRAQTQDMERQGAQGGGKRPAYDFDPPPLEDTRKQTDEALLFRHWLKQQWLSAIAAAARREAQEDHIQNYHLSQQQKENQTMTQETQNPNAPLQQFKDGAVAVKIWEQNKGDSRFVTASVGKLYKGQDGQWKESRSFSQVDLQKLQSMLPAINQEMQKWQDYYRGMEQQQAEPAQTQPQIPMQQQDMVAARDAAMQGAQAAEMQQETPSHAPEQHHEPSR